MWCYSYENEELNFTAKIYLCSDGKVAFESFGEATSWHGDWDLHGGKMVITFNHKGDERKMKSVYLCKPFKKKGVPTYNPDSKVPFFGYDSNGHSICMRLLAYLRAQQLLAHCTDAVAVRNLCNFAFCHTYEDQFDLFFVSENPYTIRESKFILSENR